MSLQSEYRWEDSWRQNRILPSLLFICKRRGLQVHLSPPTRPSPYTPSRTLYVLVIFEPAKLTAVKATSNETHQWHIHLELFRHFLFSANSLKHHDPTGQGSASPPCVYSFCCNAMQQRETNSHLPLSLLNWPRACSLLSSSHLAPAGLLAPTQQPSLLVCLLRLLFLNLNNLLSLSLFSISHQWRYSLLPLLLPPSSWSVSTSASLALRYSLSLELILFLPVKPLSSLCPVPFFSSYLPVVHSRGVKSENAVCGWYP